MSDYYPFGMTEPGYYIDVDTNSGENENHGDE